MSADNTTRIAELNDQLRNRVGVPVFGSGVPGTIMMTRGIMSLRPEQIIHVWATVRDQSTFTEGNDPYGEHDFGSADIAGAGKIFWKIDYYADENCNAGCEDPSDPEKSYRVLTIMLAEEY
jgi:hypothetical protein